MDGELIVRILDSKRRNEEMLKKLENLFKDEKGQDIIEYGLLASFISIVAVLVVKAIGLLVVPLYEAVLGAMT